MSLVLNCVLFLPALGAAVILVLPRRRPEAVRALALGVSLATLALSLALPFGFVSCTAGMSEGQITGRLLPTGKGGQFEYVQSEFVHCYENGGIFLLDEMDALMEEEMRESAAA